MTALIDTSVLIGRAAPEVDEPWVLSVISVGELQAGVLMTDDDDVRRERLRRLTSIVAEAPIIEVDTSVATRYGELRAATGRQPANDLWIAATASAHGFTLVTADARLAALPQIRTKLIP